jgi:acyl-CoA thioesterase-1
MPLRRPLLAALLLLASACSVRDAACGRPAESLQGRQEGAGAPSAITGGEGAADPMAKGGITIAFLGDSLTAGLGLLTQQAYPQKVGEMFEAEGFTGIEIDNAGLSGDTSAGGLRRVEQVLTPNVKILVVALGGNDALRGLTVSDTRENLRQIIDYAQAHGALVMLCGMKAPTNLGEDYRTAFEALYFDLLRSYQRQIVYVPFLLEGVAGHPELNQADGIHPTEAGSKIIAATLYPLLRGMVDRVNGGG